MEQNQNQNVPNVHDAHRGMPNGAVVAAVVIFILLIAGMFMFAYLKQSEQAVDVVVEPPQDEPVTDTYSYITRVDATHYFIDGLHTLVGEIPMPTPCDLLDYDVMVAESYPEQVTVDFTVINNAQMCTQVITPARFKIEAAVAKEATFRATFLGRDIELNLIPAAEGERPEDFEVFIKG